MMLAASAPVAPAPTPSSLKVARAELRARIKDKEACAERLAANAADYARAQAAWSRSNEIWQVAERTFEAVKEELQRSGFDWRISPRALEAQAAWRDSEAESRKAFGAKRDVEAARHPLEEWARSAETAVAMAVSGLIRACPNVEKLLAEFDERHRACDETGQILNLLAQHFGLAGMPGWAGWTGASRSAGHSARVEAWASAFAEMRTDADAPFPV